MALCLRPASGTPKLVGVDLSNNTIFTIIPFPKTVAFPDSYLNDVRFDLRPSLTPSGKEVAYITDSSSRRPQRYRDGRPRATAPPGATSTTSNPCARNPTSSSRSKGMPTCHHPGMGQPITPITFGSTLSTDGETLYYCVVSGRYLYPMPIALLCSQGPMSELLASSAVKTLTQKGISDSLKSDSNDIAYAGSFETNSVVTFNPANGTVQTFVRPPTPRLDGYDEREHGRVGVDKRAKPYKLYCVPLPNGGKKIMLE